MKAVLFSILLLSICNGLSLKVTNTDPYCFKIIGVQGQFLHFSYMVRGRAEDNVHFTISNGVYFKEHPKLRELDLVVPFEAEGEIKVCLSSLDERNKVFTFFSEVKNDTNSNKGITFTHINEATDKLKRV